MKREYFCCGCGLFHWVDQFNEANEYVPHQGCPNEDCVSHEGDGVPCFAVDSIGYFYFSESNKEFIDTVKWSSPKYAPNTAIEVYVKQGIEIVYED